MRRFTSADLAFEPEAKFDYIFANWILVYAIVEAVTDPWMSSACRAHAVPVMASLTLPPDKKKGRPMVTPFSLNPTGQHQAPSGFTFSTSILYCLIARDTSLPVILPSFARAAIAAWAM